MATHTYEIREEPLSQKWEEVNSLLEDHYDEVALNKQVMILNMDVEEYTRLENQGNLKCLFAYENGELVGYSWNILKHTLHYKELKVCLNDLLYVHPLYRNSPLGLRLKRETEKMAKDNDCKMMLWHAKEGTSLDRLFKIQRYTVQDIMYSKVLE